MTQPESRPIPLPETLAELSPAPEALTIGSEQASAAEQMAYMKAYASGQKVASYIMGEALAEKDAEAQEMRAQSLIDPLTGIGNRRYMEQTYLGLVTEHPPRRHNESSPAFASTHTALLIDLDNFSAINSAAGHAGGDQVLRAVADRIRQTVRERNVLARIGGDELAVILPRTDTQRGVEIAEDIRAGVDSLRIGTRSLRMTTSIGVAELVHADSLEAGLAPADSAAYASKNAGRNRVSLYDSSMPSRQD